MKRQAILVVLLLCSVVAIQAQQIQNSGFENWTNTVLWDDPDSFNTSNYQAYFILGVPNVERTTDAHSGTYAARLLTVSNSTDTAAAMFSNAVAGGSGFAGGYPYTEKPDSFSIWAKHNIGTGDSALIFVAFMNQGNMGGFGSGIFTGSQSTYTKYSFPINYFMVPGQLPDTVILIIMSAGFNGPNSGQSELIVDDFTFHGTSQLPDNSFESWSSFQTEEPDDWFTLNFFLMAVSGVSSVTKSTDSHEGSFAAQIQTVPFFDDSLGILTNGAMGDNGPVGGMAVYHNPSKLTGYYKYMPVGPDTALAGLFSYQYSVSGDSSVLVEESIIKLPPAAVYTPFSIDLAYNGWPWVDTLNITFSSSNSMDSTSYAGAGSTLLVDSLNLEYYPVGIDENEPLSFKIYPNPANDIVRIETAYTGPVHLELFTIFGAKVIETNVMAGEAVNVSLLAPGDYLYIAGSQEGISRGKMKIFR